MRFYIYCYNGPIKNLTNNYPFGIFFKGTYYLLPFYFLSPYHYDTWPDQRQINPFVLYLIPLIVCIVGPTYIFELLCYETFWQALVWNIYETNSKLISVFNMIRQMIFVAIYEIKPVLYEFANLYFESLYLHSSYLLISHRLLSVSHIKMSIFGIFIIFCY